MKAKNNKVIEKFSHKRWTESPLEDAEVIGRIPDDYISDKQEKSDALLKKMTERGKQNNEKR